MTLRTYLTIAAPAVLDAVTIVHAILRTRSVGSTLAWVFAIIAFPFVGALSYLLLASPSIRRQTLRKRLTQAAVRQALAAHVKVDPTNLARALSPIERSMLVLATSVTGQPPSAANEVELLVESSQAFDRIEEALHGARRTIWAEYYIISADQTGRRFLDLLAERARAGIEVRLLYDAVGSLRIDAHRLSAIRAAGGRAEAFLPVNPLRRRWSVHLRNHRKMIVVDGELGFTGGMNIGDEYSGWARRRGREHFRDAHLRLRGPEVQDLGQIFAEDWLFATGEQLTPPSAPPPVDGATAVVAVLPSGPDQEHNAHALVYFAGIASARERCYLTTPYFVPSDETVAALVSSALRGVDVRLMLPGRVDVLLVGPAARSYYQELVDGGVRVYEYQASMLHAKTMVVDGSWGIVGSANVDIRSFRLNFELGAMVFDPGFARKLEERFFADLGDATEITRDSLAALTLPVRFGQGVARLLSPLL